MLPLFNLKLITEIINPFLLNLFHVNQASAATNRSANLTDKQARSSFSEPNYGHQVWGASGNRFEITNLIPPVLLAGLLLLLLPICAGLLAPMFAGHSGMTYPYPHGRKKRNIYEESDFAFDAWPLNAMQLIRPFLDTLHKSLQKFSK